ncbi:HNH endonuclease [Arthrobacter sp. MYb23]|nr:HNH endonuclease [Arthrobacter sp. MYb51]PRB98579.1 HNH endonuclease [Arthrobacter sp. MYb23]
MSGGWTGSDRKSRLPDDWPLLRQIVFERAGGRCETIKKSGKRCWDKGTDVDHKRAGDDHSLANLQLLCTWHHARKSSREGNEAQAALRAMLRHPVEQHPGVITGPPRPPKNKGF